MATREALPAVRYVTDAAGQRTDVVVPLATWELLIDSWRRMAELLEDQEDRAILQAWLTGRAAGEGDTISLDELERELVADGLLPG